MYLDRTAPWKLKKAGQGNELRTVLANTCEVVRRAAMMVAPAIPSAAREILRQIGREQDCGGWPDAEWSGWPGGVLGEPNPVFPRIEPERKDDLVAKWVGEDSVKAPATRPQSQEIGIEDFQKLELRAARVLAAEKIPKTEKLLKLTLDLGSEQRTVVSGIAGAYAPEQLVGRTVIYLTNLKPAKIRGVLSMGMILAAGDADVLALAELDRDVPPGTRVR